MDSRKLNDPRPAAIVSATLLILCLLANANLARSEQKEVSNNGKTTASELAGELGLTNSQATALKKVLRDFYEKRISLAKDTATADPKKAREREQLMQREFYLELSRVLSPEQIKKYQKLIAAKKKAPEKKESKQPLDPIAKKRVHKKFPQLVGLQTSLRELELSGLQSQALDEYFNDVETQAARMLYWDPDFDPSGDPGFSAMIQTKLLWVLTETQFRNLAKILKEQSKAEEKRNKKEKTNEEPVKPPATQ